MDFENKIQDMITIPEIEKIVKEYFNCSLDLQEKTRASQHVKLRQIIIVIAVELIYNTGDCSKCSIADYFGQSHATGLYAEKQIRNLCQTDIEYNRRYCELIKICRIKKEKNKINAKVERQVNDKQKKNEVIEGYSKLIGRLNSEHHDRLKDLLVEFFIKLNEYEKVQTPQNQRS